MGIRRASQTFSGIMGEDMPMTYPRNEHLGHSLFPVDVVLHPSWWQRQAMAEGQIRWQALTHGRYPGRRLPLLVPAAVLAH